MKTYIFPIIFFLFVAMAAAIGWLSYDLKHSRAEVARQTHNVQVLNKNYRSYKNAYGQQVAKVEGLNYTVSELKTNEADLQRKLKENRIKPSDVQSVTQVGTTTLIQVKTVTQYVDSSKCFRFTDQWNSVTGCFTSRDSVDISISVRDSLNIIATNVPAHRFLWWKWGTKGVELSIVSANPYTNFNYLKYIELKK